MRSLVRTQHRLHQLPSAGGRVRSSPKRNPPCLRCARAVGRTFRTERDSRLPKSGVSRWIAMQVLAVLNCPMSTSMS